MRLTPLLLLLSGCLFIGADEVEAQSDQDGDGFVSIALGGNDCDDGAPSVHPGADDVPYDDVDSDCDGWNDFDGDRDGFVAAEFGGVDCDDQRASIGADPVDWRPDCDGDGSPAEAITTSCGVPATLCDNGQPAVQWLVARDGQPIDCDDADDTVHPARNDTPYDGIDSNCDGADDFDADGDGVRVDEDCDDLRADIYPGAPDPWYDGIDADCDGADDYDQDGDGARLEDDCNDVDPDTYPGAVDVPYDGIDSNCDGADDYDQDGDGYPVIGPNADCDDLAPDTFPGASDLPYDGIDADCDGTNDYDGDGDGYVRAGDEAAAGGTAPFVGDCDDTNSAAYPTADDPWYDGVDTDCAGNDDFDADGDGSPVPLDCDDTSPLAYPGAPDAFYDGFDTDCAGNDDFDADGDGASTRVAPIDCNDSDDSVFPGAAETWYDGIDTDCDGGNDFDRDGDGWVSPLYADEVGGTAPGVGDCDDADPARHPGQPEAWYDGVDADCDGANDFDQDGDGAVALGFGGEAAGSAQAVGDCDDTDPTRAPTVPEVYYDGVDSNCIVEDEFDQDLDGAPVGVDCDDEDPARSPAFVEIWYDGIDGNCDGANDFDQDGDGYRIDTDCDDLAAGVNPGTPEVWYDGVDADCDGRNDYDADGDGHVALGFVGAAGGTAPGVGDCDDFDPARNPAQVEVYYDGIDADCNGANDYDQDADGVVATGYGPFAGGTAAATQDCDDLDPAVSPLVGEVWYDGIDSDCDRANDFDRDGDGFVRVGDEAHAGGTAAGTGDCEDGAADIAPGLPEVYYDGIDSNCDGANDFDQDLDGYVRLGSEAQAGGTALQTGDCNDLAPGVNPGSADSGSEDRNCDGVFVVDADEDGVPAAEDCDDADPNLWVGAEPVVPVGPGDPIADWVDAACDGTTFEITGVVAVGRPLVVTRAATFRGSGRLSGSGSTRVLDARASVVIEDLTLSDGSAPDGGCLHVDGPFDLSLTGVSFEGCQAVAINPDTGLGGGLFAAGGARVTATGVVFDTNTATRGGGAFATALAASSAFTDVIGLANVAEYGGALSALDTPLTLRSATFVGDTATASGGALHLEGVQADLLAVDIADARGGPGAGAIHVERTAGVLEDISLLGVQADAAFGGSGSVAQIRGGTATLTLDYWRVLGGAATSGVHIVDPLGSLTVHDMEIGFHNGRYGLFGDSYATDSTLTIDNVWIHHIAPATSCVALELYPVFGSPDWTLRNATVTDNNCATQVWVTPYYSGPMTVRNVIGGSSFQVGFPTSGIAWASPSGQLDIAHSAVIHNRSWTQNPYLGGGATPGVLPAPCPGCTTQAGSPFAAPSPSYAVGLAPASPLAGGGDPDLCAGSLEPACLDLGFWGGPNPPRPR